LSNEYGWTTEYILSRTMREIYFRIMAINKRHRSKYKFEAALHGASFDSPTSDLNEEKELTPKQQLALDVAMKQAQERKQREFINGRRTNR